MKDFLDRLSFDYFPLINIYMQDDFLVAFQTSTIISYSFHMPELYDFARKSALKTASPAEETVVDEQFYSRAQKLKR